MGLCGRRLALWFGLMRWIMRRRQRFWRRACTGARSCRRGMFAGSWIRTERRGGRRVWGGGAPLADARGSVSGSSDWGSECSRGWGGEHRGRGTPFVSDRGETSDWGSECPRGCRALFQAAEGGADRLDVLVFRTQGLAARRTAVQMAEYLPHLVRLQSTQGELLEQVHGGMLFVFHC